MLRSVVSCCVVLNVPGPIPSPYATVIGTGVSVTKLRLLSKEKNEEEDEETGVITAEEAANTLLGKDLV